MTKDELESYLKNTPYRNYSDKNQIKNEVISYINTYTNIQITSESLGELIYIVVHDLKVKPTCTCGNPVRYHNGTYQKSCSSKCAANNGNTVRKRIETVNKKYGCDNVFQSKKIKDKIDRSNIAKYGRINPCRIGSDSFKRGMMRNHGVERAIEIPGTIDSNRRKEWARTYIHFDRFSNQIVPNFQSDDFMGGGYDKSYSWTCMTCGKSFFAWYHNGMIPKCAHCTPKSNFQSEVEDYITKLGISFQHNTRTILTSNKELDIFIPTHNIAIECNGNYWHCEGGGKTKNYHLNKTTECADNNIQLIHIFEDEWLNKKNIVKSRLRHILKKSQYRLFARDCTISEISESQKSKFLSKYHIFGNHKSLVKLGCFYKNRLIAVMTFGKRRFDCKAGYELIRYATISNFNCIGCAGKLLKYFERKYNPKSLISYADRRWSTGGLYLNLGFTYIKNSPPAYFYVTGDYLKRFNRINFQKHKLPNILTTFDPNISEWENMKANKYNRIWDCGNMVFEKMYLV